MLAQELGTLTFLDMDWQLVERELERPHGPHAENMLRDLRERVA